VSSSVVLRVGLAVGALSAPFAAPLPAQGASAGRDVILATTTSLYDTGLLDSIVPIFERQSGYHVKVVAVGSGQALAMGRRGDADVAFVHSPAAERAFMDAGYGVRRRVVASNYFTIAGPAADPARVREAADAVEALRRIADSGRPFVSRGDSSGTHARELALWAQVGVRAAGAAYIETGQGMAATLLVANERTAYVLTDRATLGALRSHVDLVALRAPERALANIYHVIELNPSGHPRMNVEGGRAFASFVVSDQVQSILAHFGEGRLGEPMFVPAYGKEPT